MNETQLEQAGYHKDVDEDDLPENKKPFKFRKRPVVVEAMRWSGTNRTPMCRFVQDLEILSWGRFNPHKPTSIFIKTLEGTHEAKPGDYIIKGVNGEFYPCKPDIFMKTYEPA